MRWQAVLILLAVVLSVMVPPAFPLLTAHGSSAAIGTLDVCHPATPTLSSSGHMPCMNEYPCTHPPLARNRAAAITAALLKPALLVFQDEHPPKA